MTIDLTQNSTLSILSLEPAEQAISHGDSAFGKYEWSDRGRNTAQYWIENLITKIYTETYETQLHL